MKLSELKAQLEETLDKVGDVDVVICSMNADETLNRDVFTTIEDPRGQLIEVPDDNQAKEDVPLPHKNLFAMFTFDPNTAPESKNFFDIVE